MKLKTAVLIIAFALSLIACSGKDNVASAPDISSSPVAAPDTSSSPVAATDTPSSAAATSSDPMQNKGIGPITSITLGPIDEKLAESGEEVFKAKCTACHKIDKRRVGPALADITNRRTPEWIMNMIINPSEMLEKDPIAKELLAEFHTQMADQDISESDARAILEYLRTKSKP